MVHNDRRDLAGQLGAQPPPGVRELSEADRADLTDALYDARRRQARALAAAGDAALGLVPALLRPAVRKVVGM